MSLRIISLLTVILSWQYQGFAQQSAAQQSIPQDTIIILQRFSDAFGNGVDYRLKVTADGTVFFEKFEDFKPAKTIKSRITCEKVMLLIAEFKKINYFNLKDKYEREEDGCPGVWTDRGGAMTSITINGRSKSINHYHGCTEGLPNAIYPRELAELENKIDEIVGTKQWLK